MTIVEKRRLEFMKNVWNHSEDPFQTQFDDRPPLSKAEISELHKVVISALNDTTAAATTKLGGIFRADDNILALSLQLVGLTRNKILQDLKAAARSGAISVKVPSSYSRLPFTEAWQFAGPYLIHRLQKVFSSLKSTPNVIPQAIESLNQATWPGYIRQERAKRSGHEAEFRLAALHLACGLPFEPEEKAENPLCRDIIIQGVSFDLVVPNGATPKVVIKSTVHTSNIGQYGESKDHLEVDEARRLIDGMVGEKPSLLAFIDGVGFESNRAGLDGVLEKSDEFCQFKTIWKAIMMSAAALGRPFEFALPSQSIAYHSEFFSRWQGASTIVCVEQKTLTGVEIEAGEAMITALS